MLENYFTLGKVIARHRAGLFGVYIDELVEQLDAEGYKRRTVRSAVAAVQRFGSFSQPALRGSLTLPAKRRVPQRLPFRRVLWNEPLLASYASQEGLLMPDSYKGKKTRLLPQSGMTAIVNRKGQGKI